MVERIINFALAADDHPLRSRPGDAGRRMHVFVIIAGRFVRQLPFSILKPGTVVGETQSLAALDPQQGRFQVHRALKLDAAFAVTNDDIVDPR